MTTSFVPKQEALKSHFLTKIDSFCYWSTSNSTVHFRASRLIFRPILPDFCTTLWRVASLSLSMLLHYTSPPNYNSTKGCFAYLITLPVSS
jgi:hypothetical protein